MALSTALATGGGTARRRIVGGPQGDTLCRHGQPITRHSQRHLNQSTFFILPQASTVKKEKEKGKSGYINVLLTADLTSQA